jgi:hypothetical protein
VASIVGAGIGPKRRRVTVEPLTKPRPRELPKSPPAQPEAPKRKEREKVPA